MLGGGGFRLGPRQRDELELVILLLFLSSRCSRRRRRRCSNMSTLPQVVDAPAWAESECKVVIARLQSFMCN